MRIGFCYTGSFCTFSKALASMKRLLLLGHSIQPIMSERAYSTDTRFALAEEFRSEVETLCGTPIIHTVESAEPLGPASPLDLLIIAPCTGNTLSKLSHGITDSAATMAAKAHLRCDRPTLIALCSNDAMSQNLESIGRLLLRKAVFFLPMRQDDPRSKPHSLVADFDRMEEGIDQALSGKQIRPIFL